MGYQLGESHLMSSTIDALSVQRLKALTSALAAYCQRTASFLRASARQHDPSNSSGTVTAGALLLRPPILGRPYLGILRSIKGAHHPRRGW